MHYSTLTIKSVVKSNEMENDMFRKIEKWVIDCYDDPKMKIKDDIVIFFYNFLNLFSSFRI